MKMLLTLYFLFEGQATQSPVGLLIDEDSCIVAGAGMTAILEHANPGLQVSWRCTPVHGDGA